MPLRSIVKLLGKENLTAELSKRVDRQERLYIKGATRSAKAIISSSISKSNNKPLLIVVPTMEDATRWFSLLQTMGWKRTFLYPTSEASPYENIDPTTEIIWGQLQVLSDLLKEGLNNDMAIIATERCLQPHLPSPEILKNKCIYITKGLNIDMKIISTNLTSIGYKRVDTVDTEGSWARRGDILDIYPVSNEYPIRIEYFGDNIEKIKEFDPITQRSLDSIDYITLTPTGFTPLISDGLRQYPKEELKSIINCETLDSLLEGCNPTNINRYMGIIWQSPSSLLDYLPKDCCVVVEERKQIIAHSNQWFNHVQDHFSEITLEKDNLGKLNPNLHIDIRECLYKADKFWGFDTQELEEIKNSENSIDLATKIIPSYPNQFGRMGEFIRKYIKENIKVIILSAQPSRTVALLQEHDCHAKYISNPSDYSSISRLIDDKVPLTLKSFGGNNIEGIEIPAWKIAIITDKEFFGQQSLTTPGYIRRRRKSVSKTVNPNKMCAGDYVVHRNHGIGRFIKIEKISLGLEFRDYLVIQYEDGTLSVAADQLGSLGRFRNTGNSNPKINKLGGATWNKTKEKARKGIKKIAIDLIKLYAERQNKPGYCYPPDGPWQNELEDSFPYETTPDQEKAIIEVKKDMEKVQPMDRLICGDVGFGKTEVAIRAIFKAITSGKQVALLTPTTVLAQQHWRTISDRFAPYPISVALLNRFKSSNERKKIHEGINKGTIDAVIGTHQLLGKNTNFKKLGLLVVDEEQRFGVTQKEKIKDLKKDIDVLTLSATPIPRTLYMSLSGVREMSLITTPPPMRRAIKTHLSAIDDEIIRGAISQELDRGGQIFYVVPKVKGIENVALKLKNMIPKIKIIIAHGQMQEGELESSMVAFNSGEADLMLCTTIVESGLDIPRVNTILIEDAHNFGLSQLYQLRGRVGRSGVQAHAWLFYPSDEILSDKSRKRLRAIQEFAQLGSGYQLAMRDMEIRGVGNILGVEQSGQMEVIGFDLYMEMLQESLAEIQGQNIPNVEETQIDLSVTAFIPGDWIQNNEEKIAAYRSATECTSREELIDLAAIWTDKYGSIPKPVESLFQILKLKLISKGIGISRIYKSQNNLILETPMEESSFMIIRKAIPEHLRGRFIYKKNNTKTSEILVRGLGVLPVEKQMDQLYDWFQLMNEQIDIDIKNKK